MARIKMNNSTYTTSSTKSQGVSDEIGKLAYQFFVERDYKHGHDQEDWLRAERIVRARRSNWK